MKQVKITVCWKCRYGNRTLYRVKDENGNKTEDYVCLSCWGMGHYRPPIGNQSFVVEQRLDKKDMNFIKEQAEKAKEANDKTV